MTPPAPARLIKTARRQTRSSPGSFTAAGADRDPVTASSVVA
jgi:hypothetical protein